MNEKSNKQQKQHKKAKNLRAISISQ
jgi:hypothetical protein